MFIKTVEAENFKCFSDKQEINFSHPKNTKSGSGLNVLIGENNSGKTAILQAITKLKDDALIYDEEKNKGNDTQIVIKTSDNKKQTIKNLTKSAHIDTSAKVRDFQLKYDEIHFIKDNRVWTSNFGSGRKDFGTYRRNINHNRQHIDSDLALSLSTLEKENRDKKIEFNRLLRRIIPSFTDWQIGASIKSGNYIAYQMLNGVDSDIDYSVGSGILNLFRIIYGLIDDGKILIIDEPEAYLYPSAQLKLAKLLIERSKKKQIIISTHSPFMFQEAVSRNSNLIIFKRTKRKISIRSAKTESWGLFKTISPTYSEINYRAYGLVTPEFHNELYGFVQSKFNKESSIKAFDTFLISKGDAKKQWKYNKITYQGATTYIRNYIHHPEQKEKNKKYTKAELKQSISFLIRLMKE